jgi:uncharacterized protein (TIGR02145 family)
MGNRTALNILVMIFFSTLVLTCEKDKDSGLPRDIDGNVYDTIVIGTQTWFKENLKTTKFKDGTSITLVTGNVNWLSYSAGAYCWYDNNPDYRNDYGALYNRKAVSYESLCPDGWHIPTNEEWSILFEYLGGSNYAGGKLKETGTLHWIRESQGTTNESGFTGLPGGFRDSHGIFQDLKESAYWWISGSDNIILLTSYNSYIATGFIYGNLGISIRCIKDN